MISTDAATVDFANRITTPSKLLPFRLLGCIWRQAAFTPHCPTEPRLDGKLALVTGGNAGIGLEISRGLAARGAELVILARNQTTASAARDAIASTTGATVHVVPLDLSDLASVVRASERLPAILAGREIDVLVANAGVAPAAYAVSAQGHELAFATNTLGHHVLIRRLLDRGQLRGGRLVVVTGDIYIRSSECTSDFRYEGRSGGQMAYCRSKLGNLWFAAELVARYPALHVCSVHPGVIASGLMGERPSSGIGAMAQGAIMLDLVAGAQAPLFCATQPGIERGGYYHNTYGLLRHPLGDPAADAAKAAALWARMEELGREFL